MSEEGLGLRFKVRIDGKDMGNWQKVDGLALEYDIKEYEAFFLDHLSKIPNVQSVNSSIVVTVIKESTVLPLARG